ncbi:MAG: hypothetical protein J0M02_04085 [Planctomycetes bacterium]|nr:hypothetical protein [Planctomycetota bacterium]
MRSAHTNGAHAAFSLIEILVATSLSVAMLALVMASLRHISRLALLGENRLVLHQSIAGVHRALDDRLRAVHPCTAWHFSVDPVPPAGFAGVGPLPAGSFSLTFMASSASLTDRSGMTERDVSDMSWWRLVWMPAPAGAGSGSRLALVPGPGLRPSRGSHWYYNPDKYGIVDLNSPTLKLYIFGIGEWARRDRRRDMNDNDFRFWSGMTAAMYDNITNRGTPTQPDIAGDDAELWLRLASGRFDLLRGSGVEIPSCAISWRDQGGHTVTYDSAAGSLVRRDASGSVVPALGHAWDNGLVADRDGLFADARAAIPSAPGESRSVQQQRPVLLSISCILTRRLGHMAADRDERDAAGNAIISQRFHLAFPLSPTLPRP